MFKRAISMSGTFLIPPPAPRDVHEANYQQVIEILGVKEASVEERIKAILETPAEELVDKLPPSSLPAVDGDTVQTAPTFAQVSDRDSNVPKGKAWCKDLLVGDMQMDVSFALTVTINSHESKIRIPGKHFGNFNATHEKSMCEETCRRYACCTLIPNRCSSGNPGPIWH